MKLRGFCSLFLICLQTFSATSSLAKANPSGHRITVDGNVLSLNGRGTHRRFTVKIYEISLYLKKPTKDSKKILSSPDLKFVKMKVLRSLEAKQLRDGFRDAFALNCGKNCVALKPYLDQLSQAVPNMKKGASFEFVFHPQEVSLSVMGGPEIVIPSGEFGNVLLLTWIGDHPPSEGLKKGILGI